MTTITRLAATGDTNLAQNNSGIRRRGGDKHLTGASASAATLANLGTAARILHGTGV